MKKNGFSSLEVLVTLIFLSVVVSLFTLYLRTTNISVSRIEKKIESRKKIESIITTLIEDLKKDSTPDTDSKIDKIWNWDGTSYDGCQINIQALSGLIDLNFFPEEIYMTDFISTLFNSNNYIRFISDVRNSEKLLFSYDDVKSIIAEQNFYNYFTVYSFANINTSDEKTLRILVSKVTGDENYTEQLIQKRKELISNRQFIQNEIDLKMLLGNHFNNVFPYVNISPPMNVHFIKEDVLYSILSNTYFNLSDAREKTSILCSLREYQEITENELLNILSISPTDELYYYVGVKNFFWKFTIDDNTQKCIVILCRRPENEVTYKTPVFYLLEKRWQ